MRVSEIQIVRPITLPIPQMVLRQYIQSSNDLSKYVAKYGDRECVRIDGQYEIPEFSESIKAADKLVADHCKQYGCE